jgi:hypothetical protein
MVKNSSEYELLRRGGPRLPDPEGDMNKMCPYLSIQTSYGDGSSITEELGMVRERWYRVEFKVRYQEGGGPRPPDPEGDAEKMWP